MSYLDRPRLHFAGRFQTTVSTVNNTPRNFDTANFTAKQQEYGDGLGGWNPRGTAIWRIVDCTVRRACYNDGTDATDSAADPVVGARLLNADNRVDAKLVDLDPQQQSVSQIWAWRLRLALPGGAVAWAGDYHVAAFTDMWKRFAAGPGDTDSVLSAYYQSLIGPLEWGELGESRLLRELRDASPGQLSIKMIVDGYVDDRKQPDFTYGRIVGTIGLAAPNEPAQALMGRMLCPTEGSPLSYAYAQTSKKRGTVTIDMGNSVPTTSVGGPPDPAVGALALAVPAGEAGEYELLGTIEYGEAAYLSTAGVQEFSATAAQLARPLMIIRPPSSTDAKSLLQEKPSGEYVRADQFVFRLNPLDADRPGLGDAPTVQIIATRFGEPAARQRIDLALNDVPLAPEKGDPPTGVPEAALHFPPWVITDEQGRAHFTLSGSDPGNPRGYIDGQVYALGYSWHGAPPALHTNPSNFISVLVWNKHPHIAEPTWWADIFPIFKQYANLYPVMRTIVDLGEYEAVLKRSDLLKLVFGLPEDDPNAMPTVRDLSRSKRELIRRWLENPLEGQREG